MNIPNCLQTHFWLLVVLILLLALGGYWYWQPDRGGTQGVLDTVAELIVTQSLRAETEITVLEASISGTLLYSDGSSLSTYQLETTDTQPLVKGVQMHQVGQLADGRLYFWQASRGNKVSTYDRLYLQKGRIFEKISLELQSGDSGAVVGSAPVLDPLGQYIWFSSERDAQDAYKRRALYQYTIDTAALKRLTNDEWMSVYQFTADAQGSLIAFSYQHLQPQAGSPPTALGVVIITPDYHTVNLFPDLELQPQHPLVFSNQPGVLLSARPKGVGVVNLLEDREIDTLEGAILVATSVSGMALIALESGQQVCETSTPYWETLSLQRVGSRGFDPLKTLNPQAYPLIAPVQMASAFAPHAPHLLVQGIDPDSCATGLLLYDYDSDTWADVDLSAEYAFFWAL